MEWRILGNNEGFDCICQKQPTQQYFDTCIISFLCLSIALLWTFGIFELDSGRWWPSSYYRVNLFAAIFSLQKELGPSRSNIVHHSDSLEV